MKKKIMEMYKRFKFKIKLWYKYSLINRIAECLYAISSKKRRGTLDYYITKLFNPALAKECDEMTALMLKQSNADREAYAQIVENCRMTPDKILSGHGNLTASQIVPEFTPQQNANIDKVKSLLGLDAEIMEHIRSTEGRSIPVMDNEAGLWSRKEIKVMPASAETEAEMEALGLRKFKPEYENPNDMTSDELDAEIESYLSKSHVTVLDKKPRALKAEKPKKKAKKKPVALPKKPAKKPIRRLSDDLQGITKKPAKKKRK